MGRWDPPSVGERRAHRDGLLHARITSFLSPDLLGKGEIRGASGVGLNWAPSPPPPKLRKDNGIVLGAE